MVRPASASTRRAEREQDDDDDDDDDQRRRAAVVAAGGGIGLSARHPRVAVALGVDHVWYIPLMLCRGLSITSALWWAGLTLLNIDQIWDLRLLHGVLPLLPSSKAPDSGDHDGNVLYYRLLVAQLGLSFVWAGTSAYLAHLFTSSLMSRWLLHYSPPAVLLRLCSLSILLSYVCHELFRVLGATQPELVAVSRSLPIWIVIAIALLAMYFSTQQDISLERDKDDRRRRLILRLKCLYAMAISSLTSLLVVIALIHFSTAASWQEGNRTPDWVPGWIPDCLRLGGGGLDWIYASSNKAEL